MKRLILLLIGLIALLSSVSAVAAQGVMGSPWFAVVHQPATDTLHWINEAGAQASMPRPTLPDETRYRDMRISPNGRYMVMVSELATMRDGIGIYDFAAGRFSQIHTAQPGERVHLGGRTIFSADSQFFAVGLFSGDFANPAWRVILFDAPTGNMVAFIDQTHPEAPDAPLSAPAVQFLDGLSVHFQLIPQAVGAAAEWPAYAWHVYRFDATRPTITDSPYNRANMDVLPLTGEIVTTYLDSAYPSASQDGQTPPFNAVGRGFPGNGPLRTIHADSTRFHLTARWANGGQSILFYSDHPMGARYWNTILADGLPGNNGHLPADPGIQDVFGTSDGFLTVNDAGILAFHNGAAPDNASMVFLMSPGDKVVYVTPVGVSFTLAPLPGAVQPPLVTTPVPPITVVAPPAPAVEVTPPPPPAPVDCSLVPPTRVTIGGQARVIPSVGTLNVRDQPNGAILTAIAGGTEFTVIGGPVCANGLQWWQMNGGGTMGWVAESTAAGYFIEPYIAPPAAEDETPVPPVAEPPVEPGCELAPPSRLAAGMNATILESGLRPHVSANGELIPLRFFQAGTSVAVTAGPTCAGGYRWWLILGEAKVGRIGNNMQPVQGWVSEGELGTYYLAP